MHLFNRISIIGLGLIGSSIARVARQNNIAKQIVAFNKNAEVLTKATALGIIDFATATLEDAVQGADLVILCTPIGAYEAIAEKIAPHLEKNAIISDIGSVKFSIIEKIGKSLAPHNLLNFIPAHPIAGSEKSGLDAGNADLFNGRQTIITPLENSSPEAVEKLKEFWQACGSHVDFMDAAMHDKIYATASHIPHFISFCYANAIAASKIKIKNNEAFKGFIRLAASNPAMWTDIFIFNKVAILADINRFFKAPSLDKINNKQDAEKLFKRLLVAKKKRVGLAYNEKENQINTDGLAYAFMHILPHIIAAITIESVSNTAHVGGGFLGLTENILAMPDNFAEVLLDNKDSANKAIELLGAQIERLAHMIEAGLVAEISGYIEKGN
jgi:cyclohexadieny/prephenate dehydrogenase